MYGADAPATSDSYAIALLAPRFFRGRLGKRRYLAERSDDAPQRRTDPDDPYRQPARPPELTQLYVRRARGESVDAAEIEKLGREALRGIVKKQAEAGVDIANNGEQQREGFFLHIRHRIADLADRGNAARAPTP